ncbi:DUF1203 domain-containing protein [Roseovarius sp. SCSIO 43702]|uniref:DUF1203 domain-containing protein n=1 Tax=Roseovarius sp. SCSIO 43702 TaxID=2823043 RepID=UPI001C739AA1|nr:DUF1203 domain-containing protein [Roseovarius sp. SCSIO 43702]QYX57422.1 DUF1203 domain-containing protein [Roseovarius sp. SCSIO 43702]
MTFQIHALDPEIFAGLFELPDDELARRNACRVTVEAKPGTPCRVSLADAEPGETVLLVHHEHQPAQSPYRASHAIFVRPGVARARPAVDEIPEVLRSRLISVRVFDAGDMMIAADVVAGTRLDAALSAAFADPQAHYVHLHYAKPGCFAASVTRA